MHAGTKKASFSSERGLGRQFVCRTSYLSERSSFCWN